MREGVIARRVSFCFFLGNGSQTIVGAAWFYLARPGKAVPEDTFWDELFGQRCGFCAQIKRAKARMAGENSYQKRSEDERSQMEWLLCGPRQLRTFWA